MYYQKQLQYQKIFHRYEFGNLGVFYQLVKLPKTEEHMNHY